MSLEIRHHPVKGRCTFTTRLIRAGEAVIEEEPLLLIVSADHALSTCATCLRPVGRRCSRRQLEGRIS